LRAFAHFAVEKSSYHESISSQNPCQTWLISFFLTTDFTECTDEELMANDSNLLFLQKIWKVTKDWATCRLGQSVVKADALQGSGKRIRLLIPCPLLCVPLRHFAV
jgi:hypothetical protein